MSSLTSGQIIKPVIWLAVPMFLGNLLQQLYVVVDLAIIGKYLGADALAAVGATYPVLIALVSVFVGLALGFAVVIGQMKGEDNRDGLRNCLANLVAITLAYGGAVSVVGGLYPNEILRTIGVPMGLRQDGIAFLQAYAFGAIPILALLALSIALRGLGDTKAAFALLALSSVLNVLLTVLFVLQLDWGVEGAAWATVVAQSTTLLFGMIFIFARHRLHWQDLAGFRLSLPVLRRALVLGTPLAAQQVLIGVAAIAMVAFVSPLGATYLAAFTILVRLEMFALIPFLDLSGALTTFAAHNMGAKRLDRVREAVRGLAMVSIVLSILVATMLFAFAEPIASIFVSDPVVLTTTADAIRTIYPFLLLYSLTVVLHGSLNGAGRTLLPLGCTVLALWVFRVPLAGYLGDLAGFDGIVWAIVASWIAGALFTLAATYRSFWNAQSVQGMQR